MGSGGRAFARDFEVVLFDRRGRGASEPGGEPHGLEREVDDVRALIDLTGAGTALVGHSFGGAVAMEAARVDQRISSIVVYEPAIGVGGSISEADIDRMDELLARGEPDAALDVAIARLDAAGLVSADARTPGPRRPESVHALAPTVPRELRAVTAPRAAPRALRGARSSRARAARHAQPGRAAGELQTSGGDASPWPARASRRPGPRRAHRGAQRGRGGCAGVSQCASDAIGRKLRPARQ